MKHRAKDTPELPGLRSLFAKHGHPMPDGFIPPAETSVEDDNVELEIPGGGTIRVPAEFADQVQFIKFPEPDTAQRADHYLLDAREKFGSIFSEPTSLDPQEWAEEANAALDRWIGSIPEDISDEDLALAGNEILNQCFAAHFRRTESFLRDLLGGKIGAMAVELREDGRSLLTRGVDFRDFISRFVRGN